MVKSHVSDVENIFEEAENLFVYVNNEIWERKWLTTIRLLTI